MNLGQSEQCKCIGAAWLMGATKDLCAEARTRITLEIETHYLESVEAHLVEGSTLVGAQTKALEELGDAEKAGRSFRRKYLTKRESKKVSKMKVEAMGPYPKTQILADVLLTVLFISAIPFLVRILFPKSPFQNAMIWCSAFFILEAYPRAWMCRLLAKRWPAHSVSGRLVLINAPVRMVSDAAFAVIMLLSYQPLPPIYALLLGFGFAIHSVIRTVIPWLRIWQKVRNGPTAWSEGHLGSNTPSAT
jgi:hypothetical protein